MTAAVSGMQAATPPCRCCPGHLWTPRYSTLSQLLLFKCCLLSLCTQSWSQHPEFLRQRRSNETELKGIGLNPHQNLVWVLLGRNVVITQTTQLDSNTPICSGCFGFFSDTSVGEQLKVSAVLMQNTVRGKIKLGDQSPVTWARHCDTIPVLEY